MGIRDQMVEAWNAADKDGDDMLNLEEMGEAMATLGEPLDEATLAAMWPGKDGGKIIFAQFTKAFCDSASEAAKGADGGEKKFFGLF